MIIKILADGGAMKPGPALSQKLGPVGINVNQLIKKEMGIGKGSGQQKKVNVANASIEQIISVAKTKMQNLLCKDLKSAVKVVVGTCVSLGVLVENKPAKEIEKDIEAGKYDKEISQIKTETSPEKKKILDEYL